MTEPFTGAGNRVTILAANDEEAKEQAKQEGRMIATFQPENE